ncbi:MAG: TlpA disulfide reductase family protein [Candidatus Omnitrophota bacterium]
MLACALTSGSTFGSPLPGEVAQERRVTIHVEGVFSAKISLMPFEGVKIGKPIAEVPDVKNGKAATIKIPAEYLPGEFVLRMDYRAKETDAPYPAEKIIFVNKQDIELTVDPPYINNDEKTKFETGETENTVYSAFMKENRVKRMPIDLLRQLLLSYDRPKSEFYAQAVKEFDQRKAEYNTWLSERAKAHQGLYVSGLFQFQHIPEMTWSGDEKERLGEIIKNYFEGIDFNDPAILRSRELSRFMDAYIGLHGMQAITTELRDSLFTRAGSLACEKASKGNPQVYGWVVDYFYAGYETYGIKDGMTMLQEHINNPNCLTSKKEQILQRLKSMERLIPGAPAPDFTINDSKGDSFRLYKWKPKPRHKLLLFWTTGCADCLKVIDGLRQWHKEPANSKRVDIAAINLDEAQVGPGKWEAVVAALPGWKHFRAKEGVNSPVAHEYAILSTPAMFLIRSKDNVIVSVSGGLDQLLKALNDL